MITVEQIPPLSTVAMEVMQLDPNNPESSVQAMENIIKPDKGIAAELLKIANSALYGRSGRIKTLKDAIALLGLKMVKNLVLMLSTSKMQSTLKGPVYRRYLREFPVLTALLTLDLYRPLGLPDLIEEAFLTGLLHRIAMSIIAVNKAEHYSALLEFSEKGSDLRELEKQSYRFDQDDVAGMIGDAWKLPEELKDTLNRIDCPTEEIPELSDLGRITILAAIIAERLLMINLLRDAEAKFTAILAVYDLSPRKFDVFDMDYLDNIKEHPFYIAAVRG
jgi:HD-like signal output (HDOD) protein